MVALRRSTRRPMVAAWLLLLAADAFAQGTLVTYDAARPAVEALAANLPEELRGAARDTAAAWPSWAARRNREIRARVAGGDEDSLVNLWLYGTSFTSQPRAVAGAAADLEMVAARRLEDFLAAAADPGPNERLRFARAVLGERGFDLSTTSGRERARRYLQERRRGMQDEFAAAAETLARAAKGNDGGAATAAFASIFSGRGLSSDTSILAGYGVATALGAIRAQGLLRPGTVRRVAIVGPGLDFTNKADGYDFYPQQTIQPFAAIDALRRLGLAAADLQVATFDLSARVNAHLAAARDRAARGEAYVLTLPTEGASGWTSALVDYWEAFGGAIGRPTPPPAAPAAAGDVRARAVRIDADVVRTLSPYDLNVVVERLPLQADERFDLVIATNVLVYYDVFEQALAAANIASMLRPGGVFLTNNAVFPTPPLKPAAQYLKVVYTPKEYDEFLWYQNEERP